MTLLCSLRARHPRRGTAQRYASTALAAALVISVPGTAVAQSAFRPPAAPLVTHSPYFSVWEMNDSTGKDWTKHWTGAVNALCGLIRIDGKTYRCMAPQPESAAAMQQTGVEITPTRTTYHYAGAGVRLSATFLKAQLTPVLDYAASPRWRFPFAPHDLGTHPTRERSGLWRRRARRARPRGRQAFRPAPS